MTMKLSPVCVYDPCPDDSGMVCDNCGKAIKYAHIVVTDAGEVRVGVECVKTLRHSGQITGKLPRHGRYDWTLAQVREAARADYQYNHPNSAE